jgi:reverse gyrase
VESIQYLWKKGYLPKVLVEEIFEKRKGYKQLWPVQLKVIEEGIFDGNSVVISASTASGKTFVGELAATKSALDGKKPSIWYHSRPWLTRSVLFLKEIMVIGLPRVCVQPTIPQQKQR